MHMTYYFGILNEAVVFEGLRPSNAGQTVGVCFLAIAMVFAAELIKYVRFKYLTTGHLTAETPYLKALFDFNHIMNCLLYGLQQFLLYTIMLMVMLYNVWLVMSICLGYVLARWLRANANARSAAVSAAQEGLVNNAVDEEDADRNCC